MMKQRDTMSGMESSMTTPTPKQSKTKVFKAPKVKRAPKSSKELAEVMDRQIAEHAADYKKLAR